MGTFSDTVVIGASAGGIVAIRKLLARVPVGFPAAILITVHQSSASSRLDSVLAAGALLPVSVVHSSQQLSPGQVYLAPPDHHMVVEDDRVTVTRGPTEMRTRPAINPLFRTAAAACGGRVIAVQLTGMLDDGVAGMLAVQRCGGLLVVQDPVDAEFPDMPQAAIDALTIDHVVPLDDMPALLERLVRQPATEAPIPDDIAIEARISGSTASRPAAVNELGEQVATACPDCGGPLWQIGSGPTAMFRCHVGHALSTRALLGAQSDVIERSLWVAVRSLSERAATLQRLADNTRSRGSRLAETYDTRAVEALAHAETARHFLLSLHTETPIEHADTTNLPAVESGSGSSDQSLPVVVD